MKELEGSTVELIHRRLSGPSPAGMVTILLVLALLGSLPLARVPLGTSCRGVVDRPGEPCILYSPVSGIVAMTRIRDRGTVRRGDTLLRIGGGKIEARLGHLRTRTQQLEMALREMDRILAGEEPEACEWLMNGHQAYCAEQRKLRNQESFHYEEFRTARQLYSQEVIPVSELEEARSRYVSLSDDRTSHTWRYFRQISSARQDLKEQLDQFRNEQRLLSHTLREYTVIAPVSGTLGDAEGFAPGSALRQGDRLGTLYPDAPLCAECLLPASDVSELEPGMPVRIRFDSRKPRHGAWLTAQIRGIDPTLVSVNGMPFRKVICTLPDPQKTDFHIPAGGTGFTAHIELGRATLLSLLLERMGSRFHPWRNRTGGTQQK